MISLIVPAPNEEDCLPGTLAALFAAANQVGSPYEVIVVNDSSTDRTATMASERGARVVDLQHRRSRRRGMRARA